MDSSAVKIENELALRRKGTEVLTCIHCENLLSIFPVFMYEDETFVCGRCPLVEMKKPVRQLAYEYVATRMMFKCSNNYLGCIEELFPYNLMLHEASCAFRKIECITWCSWTGSVNNIKKHFKENHPKLIFNKLAEITTKETPPEMILIESSNKIFKLTSTMTDNKLTLSIAFIGAAEEGFQCTVLKTDKRDPIGIITIQSDVQTFDPNLSYTLINKEAAEKLVVCVDKVERTTEEIAHNPELEQAYDNILFALKCAVCSKSMVPPIMLMAEGNSTCEACNQNPSCITYANIDEILRPSSNIRNLHLEKLTESVRYYCQYKDCGRKLIGHVEKVKHEKICPFAPLNCRYCVYSGAHEQFIEHLKLLHQDYLATNDIPVFIGKCKLGWKRNLNYCYIVRSQCIFEFEYRKIQNMHGFTLHVRRSMTIQNFDFILTFKNMNNNTNIKFRMPCSIDKQCELELPDSVITLFKQDSFLPMHVDVIDRNCQMFALT